MMRRTLSLLWLILQVGLSASAPIADARIAHGETVLHWESDSDGCPPLHQADSCQLCQVIGTGLGTPAAQDVGFVARADLAPIAVPAQTTIASGPSRGPANTRAPPVG